MAPFCSIIIPTHNRPAQVAACIESLRRLDYPPDRFEAIVVIDGHGAPAEDAMRADGRFSVASIVQPQSGPGAARNAGAAQAKGTLFVFVDDDCVPDPQWLGRLVAQHLAAPDHAIGGRTVPLAPASLCSLAAHLLIEYLYEYHNPRAENARFFASNNLAAPANLFREIGGFDERFSFAAGEDREFCERWLRCGHGMTYAPEAVMYHCYPAGLRAFLRTNYRYGRGATIFRRLTSFSPKGRGYQPASFYTGLITYPFGRVRGWKALAASALLAASQAATALGAARQALARSTVKAPPKDATGFVDRLKLFGGLLTGEKAGTGPFFVTVDVTRRCNLTCIACYCHSPLREARPRDGGEDLAPETFASLLPQLKEMGTRGIVLSGDGEPLLHPRLPELISLAKDAGFHVMLFSNGTLLDRALIGKLIDSGLDALRVSMWAATREDFAGSYPGVNISYFDRMVEGITWMAREKAVRRSATPLLQIHHPIGRGAVRNLGALVDLAVHTRCDGVSFSPMKTAKGEFAERGLTPEMEAEAITTLKREKGRLEAAGLKHNIDETIMRYRLGEAVWKHAPCYVGWLHTRVKVNGTVQPCNRCPVAMGDLSQETFRAIWNGSRYRDFRREWLRAEPGAPPPETCDCGYCCYLRDHLRVHRVFRWFLPFLRSRAAGTDASRRDSC